MVDFLEAVVSPAVAVVVAAVVVGKTGRFLDVTVSDISIPWES